jgi:hypothetical protein
LKRAIQQVALTDAKIARGALKTGYVGRKSDGNKFHVVDKGMVTRPLSNLTGSNLFGVGGFGAMAPVAMAKRSFRSSFKTRSHSQGGMEHLTVRVNDRIGKISVGTVTEGQVLFRMPLNPDSFTGSRLQIEGSLWDQFHLDNITFHYEPDVGTNQNGSLVMAIDPDFKDENQYAIGQPVNMINLTAHDAVEQVTFWDRRSIHYRNTNSEYLYTSPPTGSDGSGAYWSIPGIFVVVSNNNLSGSSIDMGTLYYSATYSFKGRNVTNSLAQFGAFDSQQTAATTAAPFTAAVITEVADDNTIDQPTNPATTSLNFTGLRASPNGTASVAAGGTSYLFTYVFSSGTTATAAASWSIFGGLGNIVDQKHGFTATETYGMIQVKNPEQGIIRLQTSNSGTWVAAPQRCTYTLVSIPTSEALFTF